MKNKTDAIKIGMADDHQLFLTSMGMLLNSFAEFEVVLTASDVESLKKKTIAMSVVELPDIMLLDVNFPENQNGVEAVQWLKENFPAVKLIALSMNNDSHDVIAMVKAGCCSYLLKDIHPAELEKAIKRVFEDDFYYTDVMNKNMNKSLAYEIKLTDKEKEFLHWAATELTYKAIADEMNITERTVDSYREKLFEKLNTTSRVGLVLTALRQKLIKL